MKEVLVEMTVLVPSDSSGEVVDFHYLSRGNVRPDYTEKDLEIVFNKVRDAVKRAQRGKKK